MKVAIIGAGDVGTQTAQRIVEADLADVVLVDIVSGKAEARALDLNSASSIVQHSRSISGTSNYQQISGADIAVITAGKARSVGQSREDLLLNNAQVIKQVGREIVRYCPHSIVIVVTNPLDAMTYLVYKTAGLACNQILGMGGVSDCARFNMLAAEELNSTSRYIHSVIIGAHSDSMVCLPRLTTVQETPLTEILASDRIERIIAETRNFGAKIVELLGQGSASLGPSAGVFLLVDAIIKDKKIIACASAYLSGQYGLKDLCIGVPVRIGRLGIEEIIELELTKDEQKALLASAETIRPLIDQLKLVLKPEND